MDVSAIFRKSLLGLVVSPTLLIAASASASATYDSSFRTRLLAEHNLARAAFGAPPLQWDNALEAQAAHYAAYLVRHHVFAHSSPRERGPTGENLWMGTHAAFTVESMFNGWEAESSRFEPGIFPSVSRSGNWHDVGHYTQIVWPQTRRVGCAIATSTSYDYLVCRYWPAGNVHGVAIAAERQVATSSRN